MRVAVFTGSHAGPPSHAAAAAAFATDLANAGTGIVYGGGHVGMMGVIADAALAEGGEVIGVIPRGLMNREIAHTRLTELRVVDSMHERKAVMAELSDGFVALPGGLGTFEELFEAWTWGMLGIHGKPCALLNVGGYFDRLLAFIEHAAGEGFVHERHRALLVVEEDPGALVRRLAAYQPPRMPQWLDRTET
jgi:uncharacterized protein (TIGR00730 family)